MRRETQHQMLENPKRREKNTASMTISERHLLHQGRDRSGKVAMAAAEKPRIILRRWVLPLGALGLRIDVPRCVPVSLRAGARLFPARPSSALSASGCKNVNAKNLVKTKNKKPHNPHSLHERRSGECVSSKTDIPSTIGVGAAARAHAVSLSAARRTH